jgi:hypothetical protein
LHIKEIPVWAKTGSKSLVLHTGHVFAPNVDDIIFGSNIELMSNKFATAMKKEFEMSILGELSFFLGLQIHQLGRGIFHFSK